MYSQSLIWSIFILLLEYIMQMMSQNTICMYVSSVDQLHLSVVHIRHICKLIPSHTELSTVSAIKQVLPVLENTNIA